MKDLKKVSNPYGDSKVMDNCGIFGAMDTSGKVFGGEGVVAAIENMKERGNGLGGGFAIYGLYPNYADYYAFHIMYLNEQARQETEEYLKIHFNIKHAEEPPTRPNQVPNPPITRVYFVEPKEENFEINETADDYAVHHVIKINEYINGAFVFSSGKDMCVFKGVGHPIDIAEHFCLDKYNGYMWTAHSRFPTNTPGWWGGAHPFSLLDWTVVHNGEISSYGTNVRYIEQFDYKCTMQTDTEVIIYAIDILMRKHHLSIETVAKIFAAPLWKDIAKMDDPQKRVATALRQVYAPFLLNGPFTIIIGHSGQMIGLTDRIRLRPLVVGEKDSMLYLSSEQSAIRLIEPKLDKSYIPAGGMPVIGSIKKPLSTVKV